MAGTKAWMKQAARKREWNNEEGKAVI